jgi:hypothetical protein
MIILPALLLIVTLVSSMQEMLQDYRLQLRANTFYEKHDYSHAESTLRQLLSTIPEGEKKSSTTFNLACTLYMQGKYADATTMFARKPKTGGNYHDIVLQARFNEGNALAMNAIGTTMKSSKTVLFRNSLDRLKSVLLNNPNDGDAKINYEIVRRYLLELDPPKRSSSSKENNSSTQQKSGISQDMTQRLLEHAQQDESALMKQLPRNKSTAAKSSSNKRDW